MEIPQSTLAIYTPTRDGRYRHDGSGITVSYKNTNYLVTAAHVSDKEMVICPAREPTHMWSVQGIITESPCPDGIRENDLIDVAIIELPEDKAASLRNLKYSFHSLESEDDNLLLEGAEVFFHGFPRDLQKIMHLPGGALLFPQPCAITVSQIKFREAEAKGLPPNRHIVGRFQHPSTAELHGEEFCPEGMSGGPIWGHDIEGNWVLCGVTTKHDKCGYLIGTRIGAVLELLRARQG